MSTLRYVRSPLRRKWALFADTVQLVVLRQIIRLNRSAARAWKWLRPLEQYLWIPGTAFIIGMLMGAIG